MSNLQTLQERLKFSRLTVPLLERLRGAKPLIMAAVPRALEASYTQIRAEPQTAKFFASESAISHAKSKQLGHWDLISNGRLDESYVRAVTHVGEVHAKIGLEPRWYIGGYSIVLAELVDTLLRARWPKPRFFGKARLALRDQAVEEVVAAVKVTLLDMDMAISVYLEESEKAKRAIEEKMQATNRAVIGAVTEAMAALAAGDLTHRIGPSIPAEYGQMRQDFNNALEKLGGSMSNIQISSRVINGSVEELSQAADDMARRTEQQAASLLQSTTALSELTEAVKKMANGASQANKAVGNVHAGAESSRKVVSEAGGAMGQIETSSREIEQIIGLIDDIAFQTNLLALNAGVEAARAGDAGRGFAVVASEVRALAQRSADAAKAIKALISTSSTQVNQGVDLVRKTGTTLDGVTSSVAKIDELISDIAAAAANQSNGLGQVNEAIGQMNEAVQQNAAMVEETTAAIHSLRQEIDGLNGNISAFKITRGGGPEPSRLPTPPQRRVHA